MTARSAVAEWLKPELLDVPVHGGSLRVARWGSGGPVVLGIHGITASHMEWPYVARELGNDVTFVAPDLRGRGGSRDLPGPFGMRAHAKDCVAILDHLEAERVLVVGHSMGGFVATIMALDHPERVTSLVLIEGGIPIAIPSPDADIEQILLALLGPSIERCRMTFESLEQCLEFWKQHPSVQDEGAWNEMFEAYVAYDLMGEPPELRSKVNIDAILGDGRDTLIEMDVRVAPEKLSCPIVLMRAPRGLLNQPVPTFPDELVAEWKQRVPQLEDELVDDVNHYTIVTSEKGAQAVARRIRQVLAGGNTEEARPL